jgi:hypothetical protein
MSFTRAKPAGYVADDPIMATEINQIDANQANAVDGANGGTYSPASDIVLPGANGIEWGALRYPKISSRTEYRSQSMGSKLGDPVGVWTYDSAEKGWTIGGTSSHALFIALDNIISGASITELRVWLRGAAGHSVLPNVMPVVTLWRMAVDGTLTSLGSASDTSATFTAYELQHYVDLALTPTFIDPSDGSRFFFYVINENGSNSVAGMVVSHARAAFTCTRIRP